MNTASLATARQVLVIKQLTPLSEPGWRAAYKLLDDYADFDEVTQEAIGEDREFAVPLIGWAVAEHWNGSGFEPGATGIVGIVATKDGVGAAPLSQPRILGDTAVYESSFLRYLAPDETENMIDHGFVVMASEDSEEDERN